MKPHQQTAYDHPCSEPEETMDPRFRRHNSRHSVILTLNIGLE